MQDTEVQQLLLDIITPAQEGKYLEFKLIQTWSEFRYYQQKAQGAKIIIRTLRSGAKKLFRSYCKDVNLGTADFNTLLAYKQLQEVIAFYEQDLETLKRMLDDYDDYLGQGNFWHSFLGGERRKWRF